MEYAVEAARSSALSETIVVLGRDGERIAGKLGLAATGRLRAVINEEWESGISSSLKTGLLALDAAAVAACVMLGDQPGLPPALIDRVIAAGRASGRPALRPVYDGRVPGHPVWLGHGLWDEVYGLAGDQGLRALFAENPELLEELPTDGAAPADIDRMDDLDGASGG